MKKECSLATQRVGSEADSIAKESGEQKISSVAFDVCETWLAPFHITALT
jgi:hypothetical protein